MTTTSATYTIVFFVPIILLNTSMLGRLKAGPAKRSAKAGPLPIPEFINPCSIGTSVSVAKYIKAATIDEMKFAHKEFPPTSAATKREGITPSCPTRPSKNPETSTPPKRSGSICNAKPQVAPVHYFNSSFLNHLKSMAARLTIEKPAIHHLY